METASTNIDLLHGARARRATLRQARSVCSTHADAHGTLRLSSVQQHMTSRIWLGAVLFLATGVVCARSLQQKAKTADAWLAEAAQLRKAGLDADAEKLLEHVVALGEPRTPQLRTCEARRQGDLVRWSRRRAQQELGEIRFTRGDYGGALELFRSKPWAPDYCGSGARSSLLLDALWQGACLDALRRTWDALALYAAYGTSLATSEASGVIAARLERIYDANGGRPELSRFADLVDDARPSWKSYTDDRTRERARPSRDLREWMRLRGLEDSRDWAGLVSFLEEAVDNEAPLGLTDSIAQVLVQHPSEAVPILIATWQRSGRACLWKTHVLGRAATPAALDFLEHQFQTDEIVNLWSARNLVYGLGISGDAGSRFLVGIEPNATDNLRTALSEWRRGELWGPSVRFMSEPAFPPPERIELPSGERLFRAAMASSHVERTPTR
jgi:hypothetical protein